MADQEDGADEAVESLQARLKTLLCENCCTNEGGHVD